MKVWVVMSGAYSDTSFESVFSTKELAEEFVERANKADSYPDYWVYSADGHELDEYLPNMRDGFKSFAVTMFRDGSSAVEDRGDRPTYTTSVHPHFVSRRADFQPYITVFTRAKDKEHAAKIANEKRVQIIAANEWPAKRK